jgi:hypothetical protein
VTFGGRWNIVLVALAFSCSRPGAVLPDRSAAVPQTAAAAEATLALLRAKEPESFKMVHQVAARYQDQTWLMTGYLLGRKDGSFRVSAAAAVGPRLFDVAKVHGKWEAQVHLAPLAERLDPKHVGLSVDRIYFLVASGPLQRHGEYWLSQSAISSDEELDAIEVWRDGETLAILRKRFFKNGKVIYDIKYERLEQVESHWLARRVRLVSSYGFSLDLEVTDYNPRFPIADDKLHVYTTARVRGKRESGCASSQGEDLPQSASAKPGALRSWALASLLLR